MSINLEGALHLIREKNCTVKEAVKYNTSTPGEEHQLEEQLRFLGIISKEDALTAGTKIYNTGTPCRKGHTSGRYVSNGMCVDCLKEYGKPGLHRVVVWLKPEQIAQVQEYIATLSEGE